MKEVDTPDHLGQNPIDDSLPTYSEIKEQQKFFT